MAAREGFARQVGRLTRVDAETSIAFSRGADLARAALCVAAEDDSLVSHSSVPLPVDAFVERLDDLSTVFLAAGYLPASGAPRAARGVLRPLPLRPQGVSKNKRAVRWAGYISSLGFDMPIRISFNTFIDIFGDVEDAAVIWLTGLQCRDLLSTRSQ